MINLDRQKLRSRGEEPIILGGNREKITLMIRGKFSSFIMHFYPFLNAITDKLPEKESQFFILNLHFSLFLDNLN